MWCHYDPWLLGSASVLHSLSLQWFICSIEVWGAARSNSLQRQLLHERRELYLLLKCDVVWHGALNLLFVLLFQFLSKASVATRSNGRPVFPSALVKALLSPPASPCRWTDEHRGEEEEEAAQEQDHLQQQPAAGSGESVREDTLPRRLCQRGPCPPGQPHRGPSAGMSRDVTACRWLLHHMWRFWVALTLLLTSFREYNFIK